VFALCDDHVLQAVETMTNRTM